MDFESWHLIATYGGYEIWGKGNERVIYDPDIKRVVLSYCI